MCGDAIESVVEGVSNWALDTVPLPPTSNALLTGLWGLAYLGHDFSTLDADQIHLPKARFDDLKPLNYEKKHSGVTPEGFGGVEFGGVEGHSGVYDKFAGLADDRGYPDRVAGMVSKWASVKSGIVDATQTFQQTLSNHDGGWRGKTYDQAMTNLESSFEELSAASGGAGAMEILVDAYAKTIKCIVDNIIDNRQQYLDDLNATDHWKEEVHNHYNSFAQKVMNEGYVPNIEGIAENNPVFTAGGPPDVEDRGGPRGPGAFDGPGGGGGGPTSFGGPKPASFDPSTLPEFKPTDPTVPPTTPPTTPPITPGLGGLTDPLRAAGDAAKNAIGQAMDAAKKAAEGAKQPTGAKGPPEGVLGLGPKGLGGASTGAGGSGGKPSGGAGLPRGLAEGKATGTPVAAAGKAPAAGMGAGAGMGAMGPPGAGAPHGAQRGGENNKGHQINKALRRKKNGQQVAGESEAVVPVVGAPDKPAQPEPAQADRADQPDQPERIRTNERPAPRPAARVDQPIQVPGQ